MLSSGSFRGRPRKFADGFVSVNKRIYITDETLSRWRSLKADLNLLTDDLLAHRLLNHFSVHFSDKTYLLHRYLIRRLKEKGRQTPLQLYVNCTHVK